MAKRQLPQEIKAGFKFNVPIQVRFSDIDGYMHVNNGIFFNYMEHARAMYLHRVCAWDFFSAGAVVANINLDFFRAIHFNDQPTAYVRCVSLGNSSFVLEQILMGPAAGGEEIIYSKATVTMVTVNLKTMKSMPVPLEYATKIREQEGLEV